MKFVKHFDGKKTTARLVVMRRVRSYVCNPPSPRVSVKSWEIINGKLITGM